jgi:hypothetical protein
MFSFWFNLERVMEKALVAQRVANQLAVTEDAVDAAIKETSQLLTGMLDARRELKVSAVFGDEAGRKVTDAIAALAVARQSVIDAHNELAELKLRAGIRTKLNVVDKPPSLKMDDATSARRAG